MESGLQEVIWEFWKDRCLIRRTQFGFIPFNTDLLQCAMQILFKTKQLNVISEVFIEFKKSL